jgi:hypothetical protein
MASISQTARADLHGIDSVLEFSIVSTVTSFMRLGKRKGKNQIFHVATMTSLAGHLLGTELIVKTTSGDTFRGELFWYVSMSSCYQTSLVMILLNPIVLSSRRESDEIA